jgi:putative nucleotidyltransferase with HDIG domain
MKSRGADDPLISSEKLMNNDGQRQNIITRTVPAQTVLALVAVAAAHDQGTDEHAHRMMHSAGATARELGCTDEDVNMLQLAALFHDIGKIGVPAAILHKPGTLNDEEWEIMRLHPQIGAQMLERTGGIFRTLAPIVVAHHERWDGEGYPFNLAGEQIPLASRILTVVDAYDAMISHRPYHDPMSRKQAEQELLRCSGTQFDPRIVDAFLCMLSKHEQAASADGMQLALAS